MVTDAYDGSVLACEHESSGVVGDDDVLVVNVLMVVETQQDCVVHCCWSTLVPFMGVMYLG